MTFHTPAIKRSESDPILRFIVADRDSSTSPSPRARRDSRASAATATGHSHAHERQHTMFTIRASAQKTTVAVDARAAKKADAKRCARAISSSSSSRGSIASRVSRGGSGRLGTRARGRKTRDGSDVFFYARSRRAWASRRDARGRARAIAVDIDRGRDRSRSIHPSSRARIHRARARRGIARGIERARLTNEIFSLKRTAPSSPRRLPSPPPPPPCSSPGPRTRKSSA